MLVPDTQRHDWLSNADSGACTLGLAISTSHTSLESENSTQIIYHIISIFQDAPGVHSESEAKLTSRLQEDRSSLLVDL